MIETLKNIKLCPSGLPHSVVERVVTNIFGHKFCCHSDCVRANTDEVDPTWIVNDKTRT
jgi:hypothetical protein